jgi:hypothetical protein
MELSESMVQQVAKHGPSVYNANANLAIFFNLDNREFDISYWIAR